MNTTRLSEPRGRITSHTGNCQIISNSQRASQLSCRSTSLIPNFRNQLRSAVVARSRQHTTWDPLQPGPIRWLGITNVATIRPTSLKSARGLRRTLSAQGAPIFRASDHHTARKSKLLPLDTLRPKPQPRPLMADFSEVGLLGRSLFSMLLYFTAVPTLVE